MAWSSKTITLTLLGGLAAVGVYAAATSGDDEQESMAATQPAESLNASGGHAGGGYYGGYPGVYVGGGRSPHAGYSNRADTGGSSNRGASSNSGYEGGGFGGVGHARSSATS